MNDHDLDQILSRQQQEEDIVPSSGFVSSVMDDIQREATTPAPIPFPWSRALPGLIVSLALAIGMIVSLLRGRVASTSHFTQNVAAQPSTMQLQDALIRFYQVSVQMGIGWILLALLLSLITVQLSRRFAAGKS